MRWVLPWGFAGAVLVVARLAAADPPAPAEPVSEDGHAFEEPVSEESELKPAPAELSDPAPTAPQPVPAVAPPIPPPASAALPRGPFGLSAGATRTLGWVTLAVSTAAGIGLTAAGLAQCQGQSLDCIQGQPLIWSGAAIGLGGIPLGLTLIVRGKQLSVGGPVALGPVAFSSGRTF